MKKVAAIELITSRRLHVVGIGGPGMSALARALVAMGHQVSGSDIRSSENISQLKELGIDIYIGHSADLIFGCDAVCASSGVPSDNIEMAAARELGIPALSRADMLASICAVASAVGVAGTHGKTTTTTLISLMLGGADGQCGFVVGGDAPGLHTNGAWSHTGLFVVEADESDGTHEKLPLCGAVMTNIDTDHLDHFGKFENIVASFTRFANAVDGPLALCVDDVELKKISEDLVARGREVLTYGVESNDPNIGLCASHIESTPSGMSFAVRISPSILPNYGGPREFEVNLRARGAHNVLNALGAIAIALHFGATHEQVTQVLSEFQGVARRFDTYSEVDGITLIDDYAHLPNEISAVISAAQGMMASRSVAASNGRLIYVFQPNRYNRMALISHEYAHAFSGADIVVITDIYASGTAVIEGVTGKLVVDAVREAHPKLQVDWVPQRSDLAQHLSDLLCEGDVCVSSGCGDIETLPAEISLERLVRQCVEELKSAQVEVVEYFPIAARTTYKVGGVARLFVEVHSEMQLEIVASICSRHPLLPVLLLGRGSNTLVSDAGFQGLCVVLGDFAQSITVEKSIEGSPVTVVLGGATALPVAARQLSAMGVSGFEWAVGVPGSVGGAVRMNAGGHGADIAASLHSAYIISLTSGCHGWVPASELGLRFRGSALGQQHVVTQVKVLLHQGVAGCGEALLADIVKWRRDHQPGGQNAGSVFVNPHDGAISAGALIDEAGLRGFRLGTACVSEKHANFIQSEQGGISADVVKLMNMVQQQVFRLAGIRLHSEIRLVGFAPGEAQAIDASNTSDSEKLETYLCGKYPK
ncbi:MAG: UDP-N-acetylmuramate--L-alanine ligase [Actinomycetes bacterium]